MDNVNWTFVMFISYLLRDYTIISHFLVGICHSVGSRKKLWSKNIYTKVQKRVFYVTCKIIFNTDLYIGKITAIRMSSCPQMPQKNVVLDPLMLPAA